MSTPKPTDENARPKMEKPFLTLADKKPSLTKLGRMGAYDSVEFDPNDRNNLLNLKSGGGLKDAIYKNRNSKNGRNNLSSESSEYRKRFGQFFNKNDKRFKSQNPKKDGPLSTRIFIDAFFPSLEGNRIFPVFNYRCAEKIERTSKDFHEKNRKRLANQLVPVSSSTPIQEVEDNSRETSTEQHNRRLEDPKNIEKILKVKEYQDDRKGDKSRKTDGPGQSYKNKELEQQADKKKKLHHSVESQELVQIHDLQQMEELHKVKEVEETLRPNSDRPNAINEQSTMNKQDQFSTGGKNDESTGNNQNQPIIGVQKVDSMVNNQNQAIDEKRNETTKQGYVTQNEPQKQAKRGEPSADEENLLHKVLRILMENEELIEFFCGKVIAKIAGRNDFCGPNCKGACGGLNDPSKKS